MTKLLQLPCPKKVILHYPGSLLKYVHHRIELNLWWSCIFIQSTFIRHKEKKGTLEQSIDSRFHLFMGALNTDLILLGIHKSSCKSSFKTTIIQKYTFVNDLQQGKSLNIIKRRCIKIPPPPKKKFQIRVACLQKKEEHSFN